MRRQIGRQAAQSGLQQHTYIFNRIQIQTSNNYMQNIAYMSLKKLFTAASLVATFWAGAIWQHSGSGHRAKSMIQNIFGQRIINTVKNIQPFFMGSHNTGFPQHLKLLGNISLWFSQQGLEMANTGIPMPQLIQDP